MTPILRISLATLAFLLGAGLVLWLVSGAFSAAQDQTRQYRYLSEALDPMTEAAQSVAWAPPDHALPRDLTPSDQASVGKALARAWRAFAAASETGETGLLTDHFAGVALERATFAAAQAHEDGTQMVVLEQTARPEFLHLDGSVLQIEAEAATVRFAIKDDQLVQYELTRDSVVTTLTNETTGWRIFLHERRAARPISAALTLAPKLKGLVGLNYYPGETPWIRFWPEYDPKATAKDLDLIAGLGANTVRIFLSVRDFGPDADGARSLGSLQDFLAQAQDRGLSVIPTLFDLKPGYHPALWSDDVAYLHRVLPVLAASPAVILVDLKNEPDLDRARYGAGLVDAWLRTMIEMTREIAPGLPLTVGWSKASAAPDLAGMLDAVTYHDYSTLAETGERLALVRQAVGPKPVLVTEIGESSYSLLFGYPGSEAAQAKELADRLSQVASADGILVWTLHDFEIADVKGFGASPWEKRLQSSYGLFTRDGRRKPAADVVAEAFETLRLNSTGQADPDCPSPSTLPTRSVDALTYSDPPDSIPLDTGQGPAIPGKAGKDPGATALPGREQL